MPGPMTISRRRSRSTQTLDSNSCKRQAAFSPNRLPDSQEKAACAATASIVKAKLRRAGGGIGRGVRQAWVYRKDFPVRADKAARARSIQGRMALRGLYVPVGASCYPIYDRNCSRSQQANTTTSLMRLASSANSSTTSLHATSRKSQSRKSE
jgi:hypothetical protein